MVSVSIGWFVDYDYADPEWLLATTGTNIFRL